MGHQFGAHHTWNGDSGNCAEDGNYSASTAFEPGSGSTIMGYAGICGGDNLQFNSDPFFHSISFDEIIDHVDNVIPDVGTRTSTGNQIPVVDAGIDYTIPARTPFALTAIGSDQDLTDVLTYSWEERDRGSRQDVNAGDNGNSPLFRVWPPAAEPTRVFPRLSDLLNNTTSIGEVLPTTTRTMNFRAVVRDNRAGGGGVSFDEMVVHVVDTSTPFRVTSPNTDSTLNARSVLAVTWDVAGTTANGINTDNVTIRLSTDGGLTFPISLAVRTQNDGSEDIVLPNVLTSQARIKVEAVENVFFDVSDVDFTITSAAPGIVATASEGGSDVSEGGAADQYELSLNSIPAGEVVVRVTANDELELSLDGTSFADTLDLTFSTTRPQTVLARAVDDFDFEGLHKGTITHMVVESADVGDYPTTLVINDLIVNIADNEIAPAQRLGPLEALMFVSENESYLRGENDPHDFALFVEAGHTVAAYLEPRSNESLTIELVDVSPAVSSQSAGTSVVLPPTRIVESGFYSLRVSGSGATSFRLRYFGNTALEDQLGDTADGSELDISNSLIPIGSGRYAVLGEFTVAPNASDREFTHFNDPGLFADISATGSPLNLADEGEKTIVTTVGNSVLPAGNITIANDGVIYAGDTLDVPFLNSSLPTTSFGQALVPFWDDLSGGSGNVFWEQRKIGGADVLIVQWENRPHFDFGGGVTFQVQLFQGGPVLTRYVYKDVTFGSVGGNSGAGATIGYQSSSTSAVEFSFNAPSLADGDVLDLAADVDEYLIDLTGMSGRPIDIALAATDGTDLTGQTLELLDRDGLTVLASGVPDPLRPGTNATNHDLSILDFAVPADGVYTLRAASTTAAEYGITVTESLALDTEPNDVGANPLRGLNETRAALGFLGDGDLVDIYQFDLGAGETLLVKTETPLDGLWELSDLDPQVEIVHPDGTTVIATDLDSGADGKNAIAIATAADPGTYFIRVAATSGSGAYLLEIDTPPSLVVTSLVPTSTGFIAEFGQELDVSVLSLYDAAALELGAADVVLTGSMHGKVAGSLVVDQSLRKVTFVKSGEPLVADTYTVRLRSASDAFKDTFGLLLDGDGDGSAGGDFRATFTVSTPQAGAITIGLPDFVRGPGQDVNVPADTTTGVPLTISNGVNVRAIEVHLRYDPRLIKITAATVGERVPAGATVLLNIATPGLALLTFFSATALPEGPNNVVNLQATVPVGSPSETYRRQQVLHLDVVTISDGRDNQFSVIVDDAVHLVSYLADVSGNSRINASDAAQVARVAALLDDGFAATVLTDPRIVGDISGNGRINAADASLVARFAALIDVPQIPPIPNAIAAASGGAPGRFGSLALLDHRHEPVAAMDNDVDAPSAANIGWEKLPDYYVAVDRLMADRPGSAGGTVDEVLEDLMDELFSPLSSVLLPNA